MATIRELPSGNHQAIVRLAGQQAQRKTFKTEQEAQAWANQVESQLRSASLPADVSVISIGTTILNALKPSTKEKYQYRLKPLISFFGSRPLDSITQQCLNKYINFRNVAAGTSRAELQYLSRCIKHARKHGMVNHDFDPFKDYKLPSPSAARTRVLTESEYQRVLIDISPKVMPVLALAWHTGMRRSELLSITRDCINWNESTLHLSDTKNGEARDVPLNKQALTILRQAIAELDRLGSSKPIVFDMTAYSVSQAFRRSCDRLGIQGAVFHTLRHTAATRYAKKGLSIPQLQAVTGHKDYRSLQRYTHVQAKDVVSMMD